MRRGALNKPLKVSFTHNSNQPGPLANRHFGINSNQTGLCWSACQAARKREFQP